MEIDKYGKVIISEDKIQVEGFHFGTFITGSPMMEVLEWALARILEDIEKQKEIEKKIAECGFSLIDIPAIENGRKTGERQCTK